MSSYTDLINFMKTEKINTKNVFFVSNAGGGKTTTLSRFVQSLPKENKTIIIEDYVEFGNQINGDSVMSLNSDEKNSTFALAEGALRENADTIVIGELRGKEILPLITAGMTGHQIAASLHGSSAEVGLNHLKSIFLYENFPEQSTEDHEYAEKIIYETVDYIVFNKRRNDPVTHTSQFSHELHKVNNDGSLDLIASTNDDGKLIVYPQHKSLDEMTDQLLTYVKENGISGEGFLITGQVGQGKTTIMKNLINNSFRENRVITIEDVIEYGKDITHTHLTSWSVSKEHSMEYLVDRALRTQNTVLSVGEIREKEVVPFINGGYSGMQAFSTIHGSSAKEGLEKLITIYNQHLTPIGKNQKDFTKLANEGISLAIGYVVFVSRTTNEELELHKVIKNEDSTLTLEKIDFLNK